jgi:hypothetical protein
LLNFSSITTFNFLKTNRDFYTLKDGSHSFYRDFVSKNSTLKNTYIHYDYFFMSFSFFYLNRNFFLLNLSVTRNFKNFLNYFYNASFLHNNFIVVDNSHFNTSPFFYLCYPESLLLKYNAFFKKNDFFLKQSYNVIFLKRFFYKTKTKTLIILNYDEFYKYIPLYFTFNCAMFSFILPSQRSDLLDFYLFKSSNFFFLEKIFFLGKIYSLYYMGYKISLLFYLNKFMFLNKKFYKILN